uniref:Uncharacterized protein n=1 Tax=Setaria italica TaxID=4555 RepID=K3XRW2_SETIT
MTGTSGANDVDGKGNDNEPEMTLGLNELRDKIEKLSEEIKKTVKDFEEQANEHKVKLRRDIVTDVRNLIQADEEEASVHGSPKGETDEEHAARLQLDEQEHREHDATNFVHPHGRKNG